MWRSRWRCVIKPAYSVSFLLSINLCMAKRSLLSEQPSYNNCPCIYSPKQIWNRHQKMVLNIASQQTYNINSYKHTFYQQTTGLTCWIKPQASAVLELVVLSHKASKYKIPLNNNNNNAIFLFVRSVSYATTVNSEEQKDKSKLGLWHCRQKSTYYLWVHACACACNLFLRLKAWQL